MQFAFVLRNNPIEGCIATKGRVHYFNNFGAIATLCMEWSLDMRTSVIGQVIAECDGKPDTS